MPYIITIGGGHLSCVIDSISTDTSESSTEIIIVDENDIDFLEIIITGRGEFEFD